MPIHRQFHSELSLNNMCITEEFMFTGEKDEDTFSESSACFDLSEQSSFSSLDIGDVVIPKGILKSTSSLSNADHSIDTWIEQAIPDFLPSTSPPSNRCRRRRSSNSNPSKYDRVKTRFYGLEDQRERPTGFRKRHSLKKTPEGKELLKTCRRFL